MTKTIKNFDDLSAWRKGHELVLGIYQLTRDFPKEEQFGITSQLRRAASSITANIAEGFERYHFKDKVRFYYQARGSAGEVQNFLMLANDLGYLPGEARKKWIDSTGEVRKLINGMIRSIEQHK